MLSVTLCQTNPIINPWYLVDGKLNKFTCGGDVCIHNYLFTFPKDVSHDPFLVLLNEENQIHLESSGKETSIFTAFNLCYFVDMFFFCGQNYISASVLSSKQEL